MRDRSHRVLLFLSGHPGSSRLVHRVLTHNGKLAAECRSERMARKVATALDMLDAQRRDKGRER